MIASQFIDVDFPYERDFVPGDLSPQRFGVPKPEALCAAYADEAEVIPESQWKELSEEIRIAGGGSTQLVTRIFNQGREGSCVANATSQAHQIVQARQFGKDRVIQLSAISLYKRIGRSPSSGAMVSSGLKEMASRGILPLNNEANQPRFPHTMPATGFYEDFPDGWEQTAAMFKGHEWLEINSLAEMGSALLRQLPVVVGRDGHSICYCDLVYQDGAMLVKYANSWGNWGEGGFGYDSAKRIKSSSRWAFALRSVTVPQFQTDATK